jgi:CPA2 family monovalent cation:H+ antiporter-2
VIGAANIGNARCLLVAIPDAFEAGQVVEQARALNPKLSIIARAHSEAELLHLKRHGASIVIVGEHEIGRAMVQLVVPGREHELPPGAPKVGA